MKPSHSVISFNIPLSEKDIPAVLTLYHYLLFISLVTLIPICKHPIWLHICLLHQPVRVSTGTIPILLPTVYQLETQGLNIFRINK